MKRHKQLQTLSRQHHNGLLAALLLKKGIAKGANEKLMSDFILDFWKQDLEEHFNSEEEILLPALVNTTFDNNLNERLLKEHEMLRSFVMSLQNKADKNLVEEFTKLLEQHIRFEERIYFPGAEKILSEEQLQQIGERLIDHSETNCMNYPVKFWE